MTKLEESREILAKLMLPLKQQNEGAAYTLLALTGLRENQPWSEASSSAIRIHDILEFLRSEYQKRYAENSRETIRRQVLHQFEQARIVDRNADDPDRPTNSGKTCYSLSADALAVVAAYGTKNFDKKASAFLKRHGSLAQAYGAERSARQLKVVAPDGAELALSPGRHNQLQKAVVEVFAARFIPDAKLIYLGDTADKGLKVDSAGFEAAGLSYSVHDKLPDVVFLLESRRFLILVEAVTAHGPFSQKRVDELERSFSKISHHRVYVTAFLTWRDFKKHIHEIAWDTEAWIAETPEHMVHFNGSKFLGPAGG